MLIETLGMALDAMVPPRCMGADDRRSHAAWPWPMVVLDWLSVNPPTCQQGSRDGHEQVPEADRRHRALRYGARSRVLAARAGRREPARDAAARRGAAVRAGARPTRR